VPDLAESLMAIPGVVGVARARAYEETRPGPPGERAYLVYHRGPLDAGELRNLELEAEVIQRDLDAIEHWIAEASEGRFEIEAVDGWLAGRPTYALVGELATGEPIAGELPRPEFPAALRESAARRWRHAAGAVLEIAELRASRGDVAGCAGLLAKATVATAQARLAGRGEWVLDEGGIVRQAGLGRTYAILAATGDRPLDLERAVTRMRVALREPQAESAARG
jgi:hypothetical protein